MHSLAITPETPPAVAENPAIILHAAAIEDASIADGVAALAARFQSDMTDQGLMDTFTLVTSLGSRFKKAKRHIKPVGRDKEADAASYWLKKLQATDNDWAAAAPDGALFEAGFALDLDAQQNSNTGMGVDEFIRCIHLSMSGADIMRLKTEIDDRGITTGLAAAGLDMAARKIEESPILGRMNFGTEHTRSFNDVDAEKTAVLFAVAAALAPEREAAAVGNLLTSRAAHGIDELAAVSKTLVETTAKATAALTWKKAQVEADRLVNTHDIAFTEIPQDQRAHLTRKYIEGDGDVDAEGLAKMATDTKSARELAWLVIEATRELKRVRREADELPLGCHCGDDDDNCILCFRNE